VNVPKYTITVKGSPEKRIRKLEALAAEAGAAGDFVLEQTLLQQAEWILREGRRLRPCLHRVRGGVGLRGRGGHAPRRTLLQWLLTLRDQGQGPLQESFLCSGYQIGSLFSPIKTGARPGYASINAS
jgi:hypothetical protein